MTPDTTYGEWCRDGRVGARERGRGVQGKVEWLWWLADGCKRAAAASKAGGKSGARRRAHLRALAARHRARARAALHSAHHRIARTLTAQVDSIAVGALDVVGLGRGRRGRNNRRLRFCAPAHLRDAILRAGKARGVRAQVVDESGTTGTCVACLRYKKAGKEVSVHALARTHAREHSLSHVCNTAHANTHTHTHTHTHPGHARTHIHTSERTCVRSAGTRVLGTPRPPATSWRTTPGWRRLPGRGTWPGSATRLG